MQIMKLSVKCQHMIDFTVLVKPTECDVLLGSMTAKATGGLAPYKEWSNGGTN
jgi:hypothetical protein